AKSYTLRHIHHFLFEAQSGLKKTAVTCCPKLEASRPSSKRLGGSSAKWTLKRPPIGIERAKRNACGTRNSPLTIRRGAASKTWPTNGTNWLSEQTAMAVIVGR